MPCQASANPAQKNTHYNLLHRDRIQAAHFVRAHTDGGWGTEADDQLEPLHRASVFLQGAPLVPEPDEPFPKVLVHEQWLAFLLLLLFSLPAQVVTLLLCQRPKHTIYTYHNLAGMYRNDKNWTRTLQRICRNLPAHHDTQGVALVKIRTCGRACNEHEIVVKSWLLAWTAAY